MMKEELPGNRGTQLPYSWPFDLPSAQIKGHVCVHPLIPTMIPTPHSRISARRETRINGETRRDRLWNPGEFGKKRASRQMVSVTQEGQGIKICQHGANTWDQLGDTNLIIERRDPGSEILRVCLGLDGGGVGEIISRRTVGKGCYSPWTLSLVVL